MESVGIISGGGKLPIAIGKNLISKNFRVVFFVLEEFYQDEIYNNFESHKINLKSAKKILNTLNSNKIKNIIMAGKISRPSLSDISFDIQTIKLAKNLLFNNTGDNKLLEAIQKFFKENGFHYFDWINYCPELFATNDHLTTIKPSISAQRNLHKALSTFKIYGCLDIGQSLIVQNQIILGLEAVEGTDNLINRCNEFKKSNDKGILAKFSKYRQNRLLDIPTIGEETINLLKKNNYEGVFIEKNGCLIINKNQTIELANKNNIFISTCVKIEQ